MSGAGRFRCGRRDDCRICGATDLADYLDLGAQPPSNSFIAPDDIAAEQRFPLTVALCPACGNSQLRDVVSAEDIFDDYLYLSSTSGALVRHYGSLVADALALDDRWRQTERFDGKGKPPKSVCSYHEVQLLFLALHHVF